jgi:hypothetical protein
MLSGSQVVTCERTDGWTDRQTKERIDLQTDFTKLIFGFWQFGEGA